MIVESIIPDSIVMIPALIALWVIAKSYVIFPKFWLVFTLSGILLPVIEIFFLLAILNPQHYYYSNVQSGWPYIIGISALTSLMVGYLMRYKALIAQRFDIFGVYSNVLKSITFYTLVVFVFALFLEFSALVLALSAGVTLYLLSTITIWIYRQYPRFWVAFGISIVVLAIADVILTFMWAFLIDMYFILYLFGWFYMIALNILMSLTIGCVMQRNKKLGIEPTGFGLLAIETKLFLLMLLLLLSYYA